MSTLPLTPVTKLDAVNSLLYSIGEAPVTNLEAASRTDVHRAEQTIDATSRTFQTKGWFFNLEPETPLTPTEPLGQYKPQDNVLKGVVSRVARTSDTRHYVWRGDKFYDRKNRTSDGFTKVVKFDLTRLLAWGELPASARDFIYLTAAVAYQVRSVGVSFKIRFEQQWADDALATFLTEESDSEEYNIFTALDIDNSSLGVH